MKSFIAATAIFAFAQASHEYGEEHWEHQFAERTFSSRPPVQEGQNPTVGATVNKNLGWSFTSKTEDFLEGTEAPFLNDMTTRSFSSEFVTEGDNWSQANTQPGLNFSSNPYEGIHLPETITELREEVKYNMEVDDVFGEPNDDDEDEDNLTFEELKRYQELWDTLRYDKDELSEEQIEKLNEERTLLTYKMMTGDKLFTESENATHNWLIALAIFVVCCPCHVLVFCLAKKRYGGSSSKSSRKPAEQPEGQTDRQMNKDNNANKVVPSDDEIIA